jgi:glycosyltransferase involved in cell wall biosynthesis
VRVIVAHNRYRSAVPSGENRVVDDEIRLLRENGVTVVPLLESSDRLQDGSMPLLAEAAVGSLYAPRGVRRFKQLLEHERPDVVHVHNLFPFISPWVIKTAAAYGIPVVMTIHNYRVRCAKGTHYRDGQVCTDCVKSLFPLAAIQHGCYQGSRIQTVPMSVGQFLHRHTWSLVSRFLVLTPFMGQQLLELGIPASRITERPTWSADIGPGAIGRSPILLFVGRLDDEKGVGVLLDAWSGTTARTRGWVLRIVGTGPLERMVRERAAGDGTLQYLGSLKDHRLTEQYRSAATVAIPSQWFEGYPRVVSEALSAATPVAASDLGSLGSLVRREFGWAVVPTVDGWRAAINVVNLKAASEKGQLGRRYWERHLSPAASSAILLRTYAEVTT